ncbi:MAG: hypothetical protein NC187_04945 [Candidatus Amulumruptor caecigallinarius]|nr:hypothetical protein [Candidatus Amulumruptor caecigallinarius]MCM1396819.1 hypothetical protein [Candidatus Amulumruptor caecigallinarius]MCM1454237.1 hypothetical protein [bacterium]
MKALIHLMLAAAVISLSCAPAAADSSSAKKELTEQQKLRKEQRKLTEKELNQKATKSARKEAKRLAKEGWKVTPGTLPLEKQLDRAYLMQYQYSDLNTPVYVMGEGMSVAGNYDAAKLQATELAKLNLVSQLQSDITAMVESTVANEQLTNEEAASLSRTVMASKNVMVQKLGRLTPVVETYRNTQKGTKEVMVRVAYNLKDAQDLAIASIKDDLMARGDTLHAKIDALRAE